MTDRFVKNIDAGVLITVIVLTVFGLITIYSATYLNESPSEQLQFTKQLIWLIIGLGVLLFITLIPIKFVYKYAYSAYAICIILLILVLFIGKGAGTRRWITLGSVWIQPAEFAKVGALLALAKFLSNDNRNLGKLRDLAIAFGLVLIPFLLIMKQPDLGSALVFLALILPLLHWSGLSGVVMFILIAPFISLVCAFNYYTFLAAMLVISLLLMIFQRGMVFFLINFILNIVVGIVTPRIWGLLMDYQKNRILTFLGLVNDPHGMGYQVIQSKVTIGSGGLFGKGFLDGTQTHLRFLPEQHTDFIFCVIGEEFGFIGVIIVLSL